MKNPSWLPLVVLSMLGLSACAGHDAVTEPGASAAGQDAVAEPVASAPEKPVATTPLEMVLTSDTFPNVPRTRVFQGSEGAALRYYAEINSDLRITTGDMLDLDLNGLLSFCGYSNVTADYLEGTESQVLISSHGPDVKVTVFFTPKIIDVSGNTTDPNLKYGWRKLIRLAAKANSQAKAKEIRAMWLLFNFTSPGPTYATRVKPAGQIQAILESEPNSTTTYPISFFVFENQNFATPYKLRLYLDASFDNAGGDALRKYYVPQSCAQCHGAANPSSSDMKKAMQGVKINYLDTDHWLDRAGGADFPAVAQTSVLPDANGASPGTPSFDSAFQQIRFMNGEIKKQNEKTEKGGFADRAVQTWIDLHGSNTSHVLPFDRSLSTNAWSGTRFPDRELLPMLNRYCYRCHSSIKFHVFDKDAVKARAALMEAYIGSKYMPEDRALDEQVKTKLKALLQAVRYDYPEPPFPEAVTYVTGSNTVEWAGNLLSIDEPTSGTGILGQFETGPPASGAMESEFESGLHTVLAQWGQDRPVNLVSYVAVKGPDAPWVDVAVYSNTAGNVKYQGWNGAAWIDGPATPQNGVYWYRGDISHAVVFYAKNYRKSPRDSTGGFHLWAYRGEERISLRSVNYPDRYVRHRGFLGDLTPVSSELDRQDATFVIRQGLVGGGSVSFESVNFPGHYLRHQGFRIKLQPADGSDLFKKDASFTPLSGVGGSGRSFESVNFPGYYLRHCSFHMWIDDNQRGNQECDPTAAVYQKDVSFDVVPGLLN